MYFVTMDCDTHSLVECRMVPTQMKGFQVRRASPEDVDWLTRVLDREGQKLKTRVERLSDRELQLHWK
jgi:poly-gamma-glutamate synthesis protein (capsule biosynthesis protein)